MIIRASNVEKGRVISRRLFILTAAKVVGPLLIGLGEPIEIAPLRSSTSDILNLASVAAYSSDIIDYKKNKKN